MRPVLLSVDEVAAVVGVQPATVRRWLRDPKHPLRGVKPGGGAWRVNARALNTFLKTGHRRRG